GCRRAPARVSLRRSSVASCSAFGGQCPLYTSGGRCPLNSSSLAPVTPDRSVADETDPSPRPRRPRGSVRGQLIAAGLELARTGGPDAVVLREVTRMVGVVPNAAYRHFADHDELLAAVCAAAMRELGDRTTERVARVRGKRGDAAAAGRRLAAIGTAYLEFAHDEPGLFATAFAVPRQHTYDSSDDVAGEDWRPLAQLRAALDELVEAGVLD